MATFNIGDAVQVRDANGAWLDGVAVAAPEGQWVDGCKAHDFPVLRVRLMGIEQEIPWPLADVRPTAEVASRESGS